MKIREGFVSNSSSCSFVIAGAKVDYNGISEEAMDAIYDSKFLFCDTGEDENFIGIELVNSEEWGLETGSITTIEIVNKTEEVSAFLEKHKIPFEALGVHCGTRQC